MPDTDKARPIFHAALALESAQRHQYLDVACQGDVKLRRVVESLLIANAEADGFMEEAAVTTTNGDAVPDDETCQYIGNYKLLQKIGEGGFGVVYMAEQQRPVVRRVALKIIKPGMDTKQVIARFEAERQALALMEHPSIAQVFDAGETESGRPYFVMELVRGVPVIEFCDQHKLTNQQRLELFRDICSAIQHAHQKGIIHRDLKPSNILVTIQNGDPLPKVIDFGIAKATQQRLTEKTLFTRFEQFVGTPAYMSPEQAQMSSLDVDTRSDIYSLGVLLYELLTGTTPLDVKQAFELGLEEVCRRIREEEFEAPSKRVSSLQLEERMGIASNRRLDASHFPGRLRGELDWIVMKAVDKDRRRRYETAAAFAADIDRYLDDETVTAVPPSAAYQLRKFIHRHRTAALTTLVVASALIIGATTTTIGMFQAIQGRKEAEVARGKMQKALKKAEGETRRALLAERAAINTSYLADMQSAQQALMLDNVALARRILERNRDYESQNDPRHWEWRALWLQCQDRAEKTLPGSRWLMGCGGRGQWVALKKGEDVKIIDADSGKVIRELSRHERPEKFAAYGSLAFARSEDNRSIKVWPELDFENPQFTIAAPDVVESYDISPNSRWLVALCSDGSAHVFDCTTGKRKRSKFVGKGYQVSVANNKLVIWQSRTIRVLDLETLNDLARQETEGQSINQLTISPNGEFIVTRPARSFVAVYSALSLQLVTCLHETSREVLGIAISPDSKRIATASSDYTVRLWDAETFTQEEKLIGHEDRVWGVAFTEDGQRLVSAGNDGTRIWNLSDMVQRFPVQRVAACKWWSCIGMSQDGTLLATTRYDGNDQRPTPGIDLSATTNLEIVESVVETGATKTGVRFSPVENLLAVGDAAGSLVLVDLDNGKTTRPVLVDQGNEVFPFEFTPDGKRLVVYTGRGPKAPDPRNPDRKCAVYSVPDRSLIATWAVPNSLDCAAISPDGETVATGSWDGVSFWPLDDLDSPVHVPLPHGVVSVDYSPDGKYLVAGGGGSSRGWIGIVDVTTRRQIDELVGHKGGVYAIRISPDGKRVASAASGKDDSLRIWDFESRREVMQFTVDARFNRQIDWSTDGNSLLMMGGNAVVTIWRVPSMDEIRKQEQNRASRLEAQNRKSGGEPHGTKRQQL